MTLSSVTVPQAIGRYPRGGLQESPSLIGTASGGGGVTSPRHCKQTAATISRIGDVAAILAPQTNFFS